MSTLTKLFAIAACALALLLGGCSCDDDAPARSDAGPADAAPPDADVPDAAPDAGAADCPGYGQVPVPEQCNAFDDDCDGEVDEGVCDDPCNDL